MLEHLEETIYDVAIIGGGIAGAGIARDAALRGLSVVLFEKNTFGSGTSSKSSKLIHGGIRYLETAWKELKSGKLKESRKNLRFVSLSLRECRTLENIAPDLVKPIQILIPILKNKSRSRWEIYAGTFLYFLLALISGQARRPRFLWTKQSVLKLMPELDQNNVIGGVVIWDHVTDDKKLVADTIRSAIRSGLLAFEEAKVMDYRFAADKGLYKIRVEIDKDTQTYNARKLVNASGPWVDKVRASAGETSPDYILPIAGSHISFKQFLPYSVILQAEDKRIFFVINTGGLSRVGTTESACPDPDALVTKDEEVSYLLDSLRIYFPKLAIDAKDILSKDSGIRPLVKPDGTLPPNEVAREHEIRRDAMGVLHVLGVKLTDHRRAAEEAVDLLVNELSSMRPHALKKTVTHRMRLNPI